MDQKKIPYFVNREQAPRLNLMPGLETILLTGFSGEQIMVVQNTIAINTSVSTHQHANEQVGIILEGRGQLTIDQETREIRKGDCYCMPSGVQHAMANIGKQPLVMIEIFYPVRRDFIEKSHQS